MNAMGSGSPINVPKARRMTRSDSAISRASIGRTMIREASSAGFIVTPPYHGSTSLAKPIPRDFAHFFGVEYPKTHRLLRHLSVRGSRGPEPERAALTF